MAPFDGAIVPTVREDLAHGGTRLLGKRLRIGRHRIAALSRSITRDCVGGGAPV
jgi:hypothetical protein